MPSCCTEEFSFQKKINKSRNFGMLFFFLISPTIRIIIIFQTYKINTGGGTIRGSTPMITPLIPSSPHIYAAARHIFDRITFTEHVLRGVFEFQGFPSGSLPRSRFFFPKMNFGFVRYTLFYTYRMRVDAPRENLSGTDTIRSNTRKMSRYY